VPMLVKHLPPLEIGKDSSYLYLAYFLT